MSVLEKIKEYKQKQGSFWLVAGPRFGGKTTSIGTLKGRTLLLDVAAKESGSLGAINMANKLGNQVSVIDIASIEEAKELLKEAVTMKQFDNIAVDGLSALAETELDKPKIKTLMNQKGANWDAWRILGTNIKNFILFVKDLANTTDKNLVVTLALKEKTDSDGNVTNTEMDIPGNMAKSEVQGKCPYFVIARQAPDKNGNPLRVIQTFNDGVYNARLDGVFDSDNPKGFKADPDTVEEGQPVGLDAALQFISSAKNTK